jgi:hypothetical protein
MSLTTGSLINFSAVGLLVGTLFFASLGIGADRDFFLMLGLCATTLGDAGFAYYLWDQAYVNNDEYGTLFACLAVVSVYAICVQFEKFREDGCDDGEREFDADADADAATPASFRPHHGATSLPTAPQEPLLDDMPSIVQPMRAGVVRRRPVAEAGE